MSSLKRHEGYLVVDHSASPGLTPEQARQMGYDPTHAGEGKVLEQATLTCMHCKTPYLKNYFRERPREYCRKCDHYICDPCAYVASLPDYVHHTFEKVRDKIFESAIKAEQLGSPIGLVDPKSIILP